MRIAIAIDCWKFSIFHRHLSQAGYTYENGAGVTDDTQCLYVETDNLNALEAVVRAANTEAANTGAPK